MDRQTRHRERELAGQFVLLAEDERLILMELEAVVEEAGAIVVGTCTDVSAALAAIIRADRIDAALLDIRLGHESIAPVAQALHERGVPFLFYTGQTAIDPLCLKWPDSRIIQKPAPGWAIVSAIAQVIDGKAADGSARQNHSIGHRL